MKTYESKIAPPNLFNHINNCPLTNYIGLGIRAHLCLMDASL